MPVSIAQTEPTPVDLWGEPYTALLPTKSVAAASQPLLDKLDEAKDSDEMVAAIAAVIDNRVKPVNDDGKPAGELIREKWDTDAVTVQQLLKLMDDITEADRPT